MAKRGASSHRRRASSAGPKPGPALSFQTVVIGFLVLVSIVAWAVERGTASTGSLAQVDEYPSFVWWQAVIVVVVIVGNAIVSTAEAALELLKPFHARALRDSGDEEGASKLQHLIDYRARYIAAAAFGNQACRFLLFLVSVTLAWPLAGAFRGTHWGPMAALILATLAVLVPILLVNMIVELVAQSYGALHSHRVALRTYRSIRLSALVFAAPTALVTGLGNLVAKRFGGTASFTIANQAEEEIKTIVESAEGTGEIESDEKQLLHSVFEFTDTVVREVMTPRVDLDAKPIDSDPAAVIELINESGHSRIPLYEGTDDAIVGIVHAKDLLTALKSGKAFTLRQLMRPAIVVPENKNLHDLLREMRLSRNQMAVVQDEFGGTSGIATIEDIVEELVGEIVDEYDDEEPEIVPEGEGYLVEGRTHLDDVNSALGSDFSSDEFDTIGGYVFGLFGRQPSQEDAIEERDYRFLVAATDGRRIGKIRIDRVESAEIAE